MFDKKIIVVGSGSWGTAIANILAENNNKVLLYSRNQDTINDINHNHLNTKYLANNTLNKNIIATNKPSDISDCEFIFLVIPTQKLNQLFELRNFIHKKATLVICNKGINIKSLKLPSETLHEFFNNEVAVLGGPNFALEIIQKKPSASLIATKNKNIESALIKLLSNNYFSVHTSDDIIGAQVCGAIKNVYAIACGMIAGLNLGENAKAALITNALNEIKTLITYFKGNIKTQESYAGIGDLILTCSDIKSRNYSFGISFIQNNNIITNTVEGFHTVAAIYKIINQNNLNMNICSTMYNILYNDLEPRTALTKLICPN